MGRNLKQNEITIRKNVEIALANSGEFVGTTDVGAVAVLLRLSSLLDSAFDTGDVDSLPQLLQRHLALMDALKLTPKSRAVVAPVSKEVKDYGKEITERYLRLIPTPAGEQTSKGPKPRNSGSGTSRKPRATVDGVAKARTRQRTGD